MEPQVLGCESLHHRSWDHSPVHGFGSRRVHTASGATAGGQVGYRWQRAAWVFGLEAQGNWADLSGSNPTQNAFLAGFANRSRIDAIGLFTGQVGYSWNSFLLYVKGGAAVTQDKYEIFLTGPQGPLPTGFIAARGSETRWGGVVASEPNMGHAELVVRA